MKQIRGFGAMTPGKRQAIARRGGIAVPSFKRTFATNRALAVEAGKKGGQRSVAVRAEKAAQRRNPQNEDPSHE